MTPGTCVTLFSLRTKRRAALWAWDAGRSVQVGLLCLLAVVLTHPWLPWWAIVALALLSVWSVRLRVEATQPDKVQRTIFVAFVPVSTRTAWVADIESVVDSDESGGDVCLGKEHIDWLTARGATRAAAWLDESARTFRPTTETADRGTPYR